MPTVNPSPFGPKPQFMLASGLPAVGYQLFFYVAGTVNTKQNTYTDSTGGSANTNPLVLNTLGEPTTQIWFTQGLSYKAVLAPATDTDPPTSPVWTIDYLRGINDSTVTIDEWIASGQIPTYVSSTSFTVPGDQTEDFHVGRRLKLTVTAGTVYGAITISAYSSLTTITLAMVPGDALDSGLSAVALSILTATNSAIPTIIPDLWLSLGDVDSATTGRLRIKQSDNTSGGITTERSDNTDVTHWVTAGDSKATIVHGPTDGILAFDGERISLNAVDMPIQIGYTSGPTTIVANTTHTFAHGLGAIPQFVVAFINCIDADQTYAVGSTLQMPLTPQIDDTHGALSQSDATNVSVYIQAGFYVVRLDTYQAAAIDVTKWKIIVKAFA